MRSIVQSFRARLSSSKNAHRQRRDLIDQRPPGIIIRPVETGDHDAVWRVVEPVIRGGETYALPRDLTRDATLAYWLGSPHDVFVAETQNDIVGTYYIHPNQRGGGAHVANCGYVTDARASGRGVAGAMCRHSLSIAATRGFRAMQFNFVVSSNERAVRLWERLGFAIVGRIPNAFQLPSHRFVDALVMFRRLDASDVLTPGVPASGKVATDESH